MTVRTDHVDMTQFLRLVDTLKNQIFEHNLVTSLEIEVISKKIKFFNFRYIFMIMIFLYDLALPF